MTEAAATAGPHDETLATLHRVFGGDTFPTSEFRDNLRSCSCRPTG